MQFHGGYATNKNTNLMLFGCYMYNLVSVQNHHQLLQRSGEGVGTVFGILGCVQCRQS